MPSQKEGSDQGSRNIHATRRTRSSCSPPTDEARSATIDTSLASLQARLSSSTLNSCLCDVRSSGRDRPDGWPLGTAASVREDIFSGGVFRRGASRRPWHSEYREVAEERTLFGYVRLRTNDGTTRLKVEATPHFIPRFLYDSRATENARKPSGSTHIPAERI